MTDPVQGSAAHRPLKVEALVRRLADGEITPDEFMAELDALVRAFDTGENCCEALTRARRRWRAVLGGT